MPAMAFVRPAASLALVAGALALTGACVPKPSLDTEADETRTPVGNVPTAGDVPTAPVQLTCNESASTYTPYTLPGSPSGTVADLPWQGLGSAYPPAGNEKFQEFGSGLPRVIECADDKSARTYLNVTDGCLDEAEFQSAPRGEIRASSDDTFRVIALGYAGSNAAPIKWTDMGVSYKFFYSTDEGAQNLPGFKAFLRYRTEDDLYVASWRVDGVAQIQRKHCGLYEPLVVDASFGAPAPNEWHTIEFTAVGDQLDAYLDGKHALSVKDSVFSWGTAGIRADAMNDAYLDDWTVFAP
jgi:hypothetical protein